MVDETKKTEDIGHTIKTDDGNMLIDDSVLNNINWVDISAAARMIKKGDRQTRNIADKEGWEKRYGKVRGLPRLHYPKKTVEDYININGPHDTTQAASSTKSTDLSLENELGNLKNDLLKGNQLSTILETNKNVMTEILKVQERNVVVEKQATFFKTSLFWMLALSVLGIGGVSTSWFFSHQEQVSRIQDLSSQVSAKDKELDQTRNSLMQTQAELNTIKTTYKDSETKLGGVNASN